MSDRIPLAGVIGHPVAHSKSPRLHNHWLAEYRLPGYYIPMDVAPEDLGAVLRMLPLAGFVGANVTIPHKEAILETADIVSDRAARIGSANTLVFHPDGRIEADTTDGYGFAENIRQAVPGWRAESGPACIFGAGGASRAVIDALLDLGAPVIRLSNRTRGRAEDLADRFGSRVQVIDWVDAATGLDGAATIVNTTSLGMIGQPPFNVALDGLTRGCVATDLVYAPLRTPFLNETARHGAHTVDGLGMLLYQAQAGFARWFGVSPQVSDATRNTILAP